MGEGEGLERKGIYRKDGSKIMVGGGRDPGKSHGESLGESRRNSPDKEEREREREWLGTEDQ